MLVSRELPEFTCSSEVPVLDNYVSHYHSMARQGWDVRMAAERGK